MEDLTKYTPTELLKLGNDTSKKHEALKEIIINKTHEIDSIEKYINDKLKELEQAEKDYIEIIAEIDRR